MPEKYDSMHCLTHWTEQNCRASRRHQSIFFCIERWWRWTSSWRCWVRRNRHQRSPATSPSHPCDKPAPFAGGIRRVSGSRRRASRPLSRSMSPQPPRIWGSEPYEAPASTCCPIARSDWRRARRPRPVPDTRRCCSPRWIKARHFYPVCRRYHSRRYPCRYPVAPIPILYPEISWCPIRYLPQPEATWQQCDISMEDRTVLK